MPRKTRLYPHTHTHTRKADILSGVGELVILWMDEILHHFDGKPWFVAIYRGMIIILGFLGAKWTSQPSNQLRMAAPCLKDLPGRFLSKHSKT